VGNILIQDNFAETIFFEYGAESGVLQPPWDKAGPWWTASEGKGSATTDSTHVRTGDLAVKLWQGTPPKNEADRRIVLREYIRTTEKDIYWSVWAYYPDMPVWDGSALYWHTGIGISWAIKTEVMVDFSGLGMQMHKSGMIMIDYSNYFDTADDVHVDTDFDISDHLDEWIHFQFHLKLTADSSGVAEAWINDVSYLSLTGLHSDPESFPAWDADNYYYVGGSPLVGASLYSDKLSLEATLWYDDMVAATEKVPETYGVYS
jgi:hypothetical protein